MRRISAAIAASAVALSLSACTYETQRDTLTGALAGTAVGLGLAAIGDGDAVGNMARGAAIGGLAGASRGIVEEIADRVYPPPQSQASQDYDGGYYGDGYGYGDPYGQPSAHGGYGQPVYQQPPQYGQPQYGQPVYGNTVYAQGYGGGNRNPYYGPSSVQRGYYPNY